MQIRCQVGAEMARARKAQRMTQAELAAKVNASQRMIAAIEGEERRPSVDLAQRIGGEDESAQDRADLQMARKIDDHIEDSVVFLQHLEIV